VLTSYIGLLIALMMDAVSVSEMSVSFYQTTRRNISLDSHLHTRRRENLTSHLPIVLKFESFLLPFSFAFIQTHWSG
jgi:hypothetical protein